MRPWREGDEAALTKHADNRKIWTNLRSNFPHPYTLDDADKWIRECISAEERALRLAIVVDGEPAGAIGIEFGRGKSEGSGEIGYWLGEELWGRGIASEAVRLVTEYAFETLSLERIEAAVLESNQASIRVLEKAGFSVYGRLRKGAQRPGKSAGELHFAKTAPAAPDNEPT